MSSIVISGNTSGSVTLSAPSVAGAQTFTLPYGAASTNSSGSNITLTNTSNAAQNITMTADGLAVILPDATTMGTGAFVFNINNAGNIPFYIQQNGGGYLYTVSAGESVSLMLLDNSTAAGKWATDKQNLSYALYSGTTLAMVNSTYVVANAPTVTVMSSTLIGMTWCEINTANSFCYCVFGTISGNTITWGTPSLIKSDTSSGAAYSKSFIVSLSSTTAIIAIAKNTSQTSYYGVTVTSGTTFTISTGALLGVAPSQSYIGLSQIGKFSSTQVWVLAYESGTSYRLSSIAHNGASAPTVSASAIYTTVNTNSFTNNYVHLSSTKGLIVYNSGSPACSTAVIVTWTGSTPSFGTSYNLSLNLLTHRGRPTTDIYGMLYAYSTSEVLFMDVYGTQGIINVSGAIPSITKGSANIRISASGDTAMYYPANFNNQYCNEGNNSSNTQSMSNWNSVAWLGTSDVPANSTIGIAGTYELKYNPGIGVSYGQKLPSDSFNVPSNVNGSQTQLDSSTAIMVAKGGSTNTAITAYILKKLW
jgi:hypothetical protein